MAGDGASEIKPEQVIAAIRDRSQKIKLLDAQLAARSPITVHRSARLCTHRSAISDEISDLTIVLEGVKRGDLAFMEEIPLARLEELLAARTDRNPRLRGAPLEKMLMMIEAAARAFSMPLEMPLPSYSTAGAVMAASSEATQSSVGGQMDAAMAEVNRDAAAPVEASAREELARLQIRRSDEFV